MIKRTKLLAAVLIFSLGMSGCASNTTGQNAAIGVGVVAVLLGVAAARRGGGGGGGAAATDYDWDWDQIYNQYRQLVWVCRGVQTTQFAEAWHCNGKLQTDLRWPNK